jgi:hypothetical protein
LQSEDCDAASVRLPCASVVLDRLTTLPKWRCESGKSTPVPPHLESGNPRAEIYHPKWEHGRGAQQRSCKFGCDGERDIATEKRRHEFELLQCFKNGVGSSL